VNVLVALGEGEAPALQLTPDPVESGEELVALVDGEDAGPLQPPCVRPGAGQVVARQAEVEREALGERHHRVGGRDSEALLPQAHRLGGG